MVGLPGGAANSGFGLSGLGAGQSTRELPGAGVGLGSGSGGFGQGTNDNTIPQPPMKSPFLTY